MEIRDKKLHYVISTAIIHKDGKYLIVQRNPDKKAFPGKWTAPGGRLEIEDYINLPKTTSDIWYFAIENSLRREVKEETNLEVGEFKYLCDMTYIHPDGVPAAILSYWCDWKSGDVKLNNENIKYVWVGFEEAKNYDLVEGLLGEIEMVDKILRQNPKN